jgi:hypothetical protein
MGLQHKLATMGDIFPAGAATARTLFASADGILLCYGATVPTDGTAGFATGCIFIHSDGDTAGTLVYVNEGSVTSCDFDASHS